jgi:long-chain fatty acid transport protein
LLNTAFNANFKRTGVLFLQICTLSFRQVITPCCWPEEMNRLLRSFAILALLALCTPALAGGFMVRENSAEAVAMSYAGNGSRADGPDTVFSNPAGMTRLQSSALEFGSAAILPSVTFSGGARQSGTPIAGNDGGDSGRAALIPNMYGVIKLGSDFAAGIAVTVPFGNANEYDKAWFGRYLGTKTSALSADINPNIAWRINRFLSVGAGVSAQYLKLDVTSGIDQAAIFGVPAPDAFYRFKAHDWAFGFNGGVLADFQNGIRAGLTYRSAIDHKIEGTLDFTGASPLLGLINGAASAKTRMPATTGLSVTGDIAPRFTLAADLQFTQWSVFKNVVIESKNAPFANVEGYRDSWMIAVGGIFRVNDRWSLKSGIAFDETPVTSRFRAVSLPDSDRYLLGFGTSYQLTEAMSVEGAYGHSFAFNHPNMNSSVNNTDTITHSVVLNGRFGVDVDILAFTFRYRI